MRLQKTTWVATVELARIRCFQVHIRFFRKGGAAKRGLPTLARAGNHDNQVLACHVRESGNEDARDHDDTANPGHPRNSKLTVNFAIAQKFTRLVKPPSTTTFEPVVNEAAGEAKNAATFAISSARPIRPIGLRFK